MQKKGDLNNQSHKHLTKWSEGIANRVHGHEVKTKNHEVVAE